MKLAVAFAVFALPFLLPNPAAAAPPVQPTFCSELICADIATRVTVGDKILSSPTLSLDHDSRYDDGFRVNYGDGLAYEIDVVKTDLKACDAPDAKTVADGNTHYVVRRKSDRAFLEYEGLKCFEIHITTANSCSICLEQSLQLVWILSGRRMYFESGQSITTPFDLKLNMRGLLPAG